MSTSLSATNEPVAVIVGTDRMERLERLDELADDLPLWGVALARTLTDTGERHDLDVARELGIALDEE